MAETIWLFIFEDKFICRAPFNKKAIESALNNKIRYKQRNSQSSGQIWEAQIFAIHIPTCKVSWFVF